MYDYILQQYYIFSIYSLLDEIRQRKQHNSNRKKILQKGEAAKKT